MTRQYFQVKIIDMKIIPAKDRTWQGVAKKRNASTDVYDVANITDGTITCTIKKKDAPLWANQTLWKEISGVIVTPASGIYTLTFLDTDSSDDDLGMYEHRIEYIDSTGLKALLAMGDFRIGY